MASALATANRRADLVIRRIPDPETGKLVTYLPLFQLAAQLGISPNTLGKWARAGAVRSPGILGGHRHVAAADAVRIRMMSPKEKIAAGLHLTPADALEKSREYFQVNQRRTIPTATQRFEGWDDYDVQAVIDGILDGRPIAALAEEMERTYSGVANIVSRLRSAGELPPSSPEDDGAWLVEGMELLTAEERAQLVFTR